MYIRGEKIPLYDEAATPYAAGVRIARDVLLQPGQETLVPGRVRYRGAMDKHAVTTPIRGFMSKHGVLVGRVLVNTRKP